MQHSERWVFLYESHAIWSLSLFGAHTWGCCNNALIVALAIYVGSWRCIHCQMYQSPLNTWILILILSIASNNEFSCIYQAFHFIPVKISPRYASTLNWNIELSTHATQKYSSKQKCVSSHTTMLVALSQRVTVEKYWRNHCVIHKEFNRLFIRNLDAIFLRDLFIKRSLIFCWKNKNRMEEFPELESPQRCRLCGVNGLYVIDILENTEPGEPINPEALSEKIFRFVGIRVINLNFTWIRSMQIRKY